jgi:hypothetical protein
MFWSRSLARYASDAFGLSRKSYAEWQGDVKLVAATSPADGKLAKIRPLRVPQSVGQADLSTCVERLDRPGVEESPVFIWNLKVDAKPQCFSICSKHSAIGAQKLAPSRLKKSVGA